MRYNPDNTNSSLAIDTPTQPTQFLNLIPPPVPAYSPEAGGAFYHSTSHIFPSLDVRPRLGSNSSSGPGMAHAHRNTALPHPGSQITTRDIYSPAIPSFRRGASDHTPRSPSLPTSIRRHPLSPGSGSNFTGPPRMDPYSSKAGPNIPPLNAQTTLGSLTYADSQATPIKVDISGTIDKGFFLADNEWTCYRRNYFSCICSYSLTPTWSNHPIQFIPTGSQQAYNVLGFAMCISAVVADNDSHAIDLVQHTPKRDKGPVAKPEKVRLSAKPAQSSHHPMNIYNPGDHARAYEQGYGQASQTSFPTEHTFERIQFKQATANNGKRRAAQQYYTLCIELWADIGNQQGGTENFVRVAYRKSAKMIVRGRSPGHYQSERRGSTSSGPGGSGGGSIGGGYPSSVMGPDYPSNSTALLSNYGTAYDARSGGYGNRHHHDVGMEPMISAEEIKAMSEAKGYQYYPASLYESSHNPHQEVEMFSHARNETGHSAPQGNSSYDMNTKIKTEMEVSSLPSVMHPGLSYNTQPCRRFEGKPGSSGYYPMMIAPTTTMNMT